MTRLFKTRHSSAWLPAVGALCLASACSESAPSSPTSSADDELVATGDTAIAYALMVRDPEGYTDYLMAGNDLPTGTLDTSRGIELPGGNYFSSDSAVYYMNFESKTLQRYVVNQALQVGLDGEISVAEYAGCTPVFFSETTAYCIDPNDGLLIEFDPTAMEIKREIEVPELVREGYSGEINRAERVGDRYLASIVYTTDDTTAEDSTIAITIEPDSEHPLSVLRDERAVSTDSAFSDDEGNFYALADGSAGYYSLVEGQPVQPRLVRVKHGANVIDQDYLLDLGELFDAPAVNGLWPLNDTKFVLQVWRGKAPCEETLTADDLDVKPNWEWYIVDAETHETTPISQLGRSTTSYSLLRFIVDDQLYLQQYVVENEDYNAAHIELYKVSEDAKVEKIVQSRRGDLRSITRVKVAGK